MIREFTKNKRERTNQAQHLYILPSFMVVTWRMASGSRVKEVPLARYILDLETGNDDQKGTDQMQKKGFSWICMERT
jgi:hypothetical protein